MIQLNTNKIAYLFYFGAALLLFGRAYQHLFFEGPYRAFFLDEDLFYWCVSALGGDWITYVNDPKIDNRILLYTRLVGFFWLLTGCLFLFPYYLGRRLLLILASLSSLFLFFLAFCYYLDKGYQWAQWIEYSSQFLMPLLAVWAGRFWRKDLLILTGKIAVALTFLGHGLYALGVFPLPGHFVQMTILSLGLTNAQAATFIYVAGVLDMFVVVLVFIPKIDRWALIYAAIWGLLTSVARPWTMIIPGHLFWLSLHQSVFEFLVRVPHFLLPFLIYLMLSKE